MSTGTTQLGGFDFDEQALSSYLENVVDGFSGPLCASKFANGQSNPTYRIDAASGVYVLRRKPPGELLKSAHYDEMNRVIASVHDIDVQAVGLSDYGRPDGYIWAYRQKKSMWLPIAGVGRLPGFLTGISILRSVSFGLPPFCKG